MKNKCLFLLFLILIFIAPRAYSQNLDWIFSCGDQAHPEYFREIANLEKSGISGQIINKELRKRLPRQPLGVNSECLYDVILRYSDESITEIFRKRIIENAQAVKIDGKYFREFKTETDIPASVETKLKKLKGRVFKNQQRYDHELQNLLTKEEYAAYGFAIVRSGRLDPDNYSADIYSLLRTRNKKYTEKERFIRQLKVLKHAVSYEYFLDRHINELDVSSRLNVLLYVVKNSFPDHPTFGYYVSARLEEIYKAHPDEYLAFVKSNQEGLPDVFRCVIDKTCP